MRRGICTAGNPEKWGNAMDEKKAIIDDLVKALNEASAAYYGGKEEILSNFEWDAMFDELM